MYKENITKHLTKSLILGYKTKGYQTLDTNGNGTNLGVYKEYKYYSKDFYLDNLTNNNVLNVQINNNTFINHLVFDIDHMDSGIYLDTYLPTPTYLIRNKSNNKSHYIYTLKNPILKSNEKSLKLYFDIWKSINFLLNGDLLYTQQITKNPFNEKYYTTHFNNSKFTLNDFIDFIDKKHITDYKEFRSKMILNEDSRHISLFENLRKQSYLKVQKLSENDFEKWIWMEGEFLNSNFENPIKPNSIIKSIFNFCIKNKDNFDPKNRGVMELKDKNLTLKQKQKLGINYTHKIKIEKMKLKIEKGFIDMKSQKVKINMSSLSQFLKIDRSNLYKYKDFLEELNIKYS